MFYSRRCYKSIIKLIIESRPHRWFMSTTSWIHGCSSLYLMSKKQNNNIPDVQTIYPYPGPTKSEVWEYFRFLELKEGPSTRHNLDMTHAVCKWCRGKIYQQSQRSFLDLSLDGVKNVVKASQIVNKKRCRLTPQNINLLVFLNFFLDYWWHFLWSVFHLVTAICFQVFAISDAYKFLFLN